MGYTGLLAVGVVLCLVALRSLPSDQSNDVIQSLGTDRSKPWLGCFNAFHRTNLHPNHLSVRANCDVQRQHSAGHDYQCVLRVFAMLRNHGMFLPQSRGRMDICLLTVCALRHEDKRDIYFIRRIEETR